MYERFFGLADAPFRLTPDPRYLFLSQKHADALAHLKLGLSESSGFVCITGDVGTGKTTLLRAFLTGPIPDTETAYVFNPVLSNLETTTEKLLRIILVGQPQLRTLLLHPELVQLNQRITLRWHIGPLTRQETAAYVEHRLAIASQGHAGPIFTRPALRLIHRRS